MCGSNVFLNDSTPAMLMAVGKLCMRVGELGTDGKRRQTGSPIVGGLSHVAMIVRVDWGLGTQLTAQHLNGTV